MAQSKDITVTIRFDAATIADVLRRAVSWSARMRWRIVWRRYREGVDVEPFAYVKAGDMGRVAIVNDPYRNKVLNLTCEYRKGYLGWTDSLLQGRAAGRIVPRETWDFALRASRHARLQANNTRRLPA